MRILYLSDVHTNPKTEWKLINVLLHEKYDLVLSSGDWDVIPIPIENPHRILKAPLLSTYGNHDNPKVIEAYKALLQDGKPKTIKINGEKLIICGLGGAVVRDPYSFPETWHEPEYYLEKYLKMRKQLQKKGHCNILITHDSPQAIIEAEKKHLDPTILNEIDHKSYRLVFDLIATLLQPNIYLTGHVHSTRATYTTITPHDIYGPAEPVPILKTIFTNDAYAIIDTTTNQIEIKDPKTLQTLKKINPKTHPTLVLLK